MLAVMFIMAGFSKIGGYAGTQAYMESAGLPGLLLFAQGPGEWSLSANLQARRVEA